MQRFQRPEDLDDAQRCVVRQHDAAGADADSLRRTRQMRDPRGAQTYNGITFALDSK